MGASDTLSQNAKGDPLALLRAHPLFEGLPPARIKELASHMVRRVARRGSLIFAKDDPGTGLIGVVGGNTHRSAVAKRPIASSLLSKSSFCLRRSITL